MRRPRPQRKSAGLTLPTKGRALLRVMPGPQADWFQADALTDDRRRELSHLAAVESHGLSPQGPPLARAREGELISEPVGIGAIQVPAAASRSC